MTLLFFFFFFFPSGGFAHFLTPARLGLLVGHKITGLRMVLEDGVAHSVDSSENAFKAAAMGAMRSCECYLTLSMHSSHTVCLSVSHSFGDC